MRTIVHLSDLHFGRVNPAILPPLLEFIREAKPDLVAISGDLTQRARTAEFTAARDFLDAIPFPRIVVPGNHDVPLYNVFSRFVRRLDRYRRYITDDLAPFFSDDEIAVAGVNTARSFTFKDGRVSTAQIAALRTRLQKVTGGQTKIVVTHHPFDLPAGAEGGRVVGRARQAMAALAECRVDLLLAGHFHIAHTGSSAARFHIPGYSALVVSSGTSTSTRGRGQPNSFNVIRTAASRIGVECWAWQPARAQFARQSDAHFARTPEGWSAAT
jgi:3',5'-cyclic AMP phosphodiesterase CpdA